MKSSRRFAPLSLLALLLCVRPVTAQKPPSRTSIAARPASSSGTVVVPDKFLRRWDPVTIFFAHDTGPSGGGPEDHPDRFVTIAPEHPGAFEWLDARTLQFRPAEPWPPLSRTTFRAEDRSVQLTTLMEAPLATIPAAETEGLENVEAITLTFSEPLDLEALRKMVTIELRSLPGIGSGSDSSTSPSRWLNRDDFDVKAVERHARSQNAAYVLALKHALPLGQRVVVHLRLSLDDASPDPFAEIRFSTAEPFRVTALGALGNRFPVTPQGSRYTREQAINGGSENRSVVVEFSSAPKELSPLEARSLVRFTPAVPDLSFAVHDKTLEVSGKFAWDTIYRVALVPSPLQDKNGRRLDMSGESEVFLYFPRKPAYLKWTAGQGIVERLGPQTLPMEGRGRSGSTCASTASTPSTGRSGLSRNSRSSRRGRSAAGARRGAGAARRSAALPNAGGACAAASRRSARRRSRRSCRCRSGRRAAPRPSASTSSAHLAFIAGKGAAGHLPRRPAAPRQLDASAPGCASRSPTSTLYDRRGAGGRSLRRHLAVHGRARCRRQGEGRGQSSRRRTLLRNGKRWPRQRRIPRAPRPGRRRATSTRRRRR